MPIKNVLPFLLFPLLLQGQPALPWFYYQVGDTLTVIAKSGLTIREGSSKESKKIGTAEFGQKLIAKSGFEGSEVIEHRAGSWLKIKYGNLEGYVFSGFVTTLKIPDFEMDKLECSNLAWFEKMARSNVDALVCKGEKVYKGFDLDGKDWGTSNWEIYGDETIIRHVLGYEYEDLIIESTTINMNEVLNILEAYIEKIKKKCPDEFYMKEGNKLGIDIKHDEKGHIKSIQCYQMEFTAERAINKTIIRLRLWDL